MVTSLLKSNFHKITTAFFLPTSKLCLQAVLSHVIQIARRDFGTRPNRVPLH
jgi:hypothetical protein